MCVCGCHLPPFLPWSLVDSIDGYMPDTVTVSVYVTPVSVSSHSRPSLHNFMGRPVVLRHRRISLDDGSTQIILRSIGNLLQPVYEALYSVPILKYLRKGFGGSCVLIIPRDFSRTSSYHRLPQPSRLSDRALRTYSGTARNGEESGRQLGRACPGSLTA